MSICGAALDGEIVNFSRDLTCNLTLEVVLFKYMVLVMHVPFWRECGVDFQKQIALHLKVRVYLPDDFIIRRGEVDDELYVINRGFCEMESDPDSFEHGTAPLRYDPDEAEDSQYTSDFISDAILSSRNQQPETDPDFYPQRPPSKNLTQLSRGQAIGEIALLMNYERTANVRAVSYVEMCVLTRSTFQEVVKKYPSDRRHVIMQILTTFMNQNEARRGLCPLKHMVHSVFHDGDSRIQLTTHRAAQLVAEVIDPKLHDETMMFGIDDSLAQQLAAHKHGRQTDAGISPALEARLQQMEETQAQTVDLLLARIAHIDHSLEQLTRLVHDHVVNPSDTIQMFVLANPQSPGFESSMSEPHHAPQSPSETDRRYLLRAHSSHIVRLRSRSASMTLIQGTRITEDQPLGASETANAYPQGPTLESFSNGPEPRRALDGLPISPEIKCSYLARSNTVSLLRPRASSPALLRTRSSSMTKLQGMSIAENQPLHSPDPPAKQTTRHRHGKHIRRSLPGAAKDPKRRRNSTTIDRATLPELFGRLLPFGFSSSESTTQSPTLYADQLFHQNSAQR